jgi:heme/copper-type cytochrome/quinol oxidase subunit 3
MKQMISIWFFIGCLLMIYGLLILYAGVQAFAEVPVHGGAEQGLHLSLWWGIGMTLLGSGYVVHFRPRR